MAETMKEIYWVGSSKKDLMKMPGDVQDIFGFALHLAQSGAKHPDAKPLKGFGGTSVLEVVENYKGNTYRAVYTIRYSNAVYVIHCFQKKSHQGITTPKRDIEVIKSRLKFLEESCGGL
jgi:phage-related protein